MSTGIGPDNIDIVLNELDALVNIDLKTRKPKTQLTSLNIIRIGTSGSLQADIPVDAFLISSHGLDINGMLHFYQIKGISNPEIEDAFIEHTNWDKNKDIMFKGMTGTAGGFYGPQGRVLRLPLHDAGLNSKLDNFNHKEFRITNFEMETSVIYGLSKLLGHEALSLNAIIANRATGDFSKDPKGTVEKLILYALERIVNI